MNLSPTNSGMISNMRQAQILRNSFSMKKRMAASGAVLDMALPSVEQAFLGLQERVDKILHGSSGLPCAEAVQMELQKCECFAKSILESSSKAQMPSNASSSTLLTFEKGQREKTPSSPFSPQFTPSIRKRIAKQVSGLADSIITDPKVFITPGILSKYVRTQAMLGFPGNIPQAFVLYASKPIPKSRRGRLEFKYSNPAMPSSAISLSIARMALDSAIAAKDLSLCFDIINTSVCTTAFRRSKIIRRTLLPISALALTPPAAYALASQLALHQVTMDASMATNLYLAGMLAYVGFTATIGVVAISTANDQMSRITWELGTPLRERWLREEERALIDRVASAWGFQEINRRGEEEGHDWDVLREWVGLRGMVLDRVELMDGME
jgi:hypothetical protein